ncbi:DUF1206 domain-containing protein [Streptomyces sp. NPDC059956]|uniref:DUF1206 domain-containing protein n=1 Tax=Streptomyces sp. NPDC059956 TaxID=3347015 RepID=UPI003661D28E
MTAGGAVREGVETASSGGRARGVLARCGLVTRGLLYVLIGVLAVRVAFGVSGGESADRTGALQELAEKPFGGVLVWAVGIGLVCMTLWRLSEAVLGAAGPDGDKPGKRLAAAARAGIGQHLDVLPGPLRSGLADRLGHGVRVADDQRRHLLARAVEAVEVGKPARQPLDGVLDRAPLLGSGQLLL